MVEKCYVFKDQADFEQVCDKLDKWGITFRRGQKTREVMPELTEHHQVIYWAPGENLTYSDLIFFKTPPKWAITKYDEVDSVEELVPKEYRKKIKTQKELTW